MPTTLSRRNLQFVSPFAAILCVLSACALAGPLATLEYEADFGAASDATPDKMQSLLDVLNRRLGDVGQAQTVSANRLKVEINRDATLDELQDLRRKLETVGELQFRIIVQPHLAEHKSIADAARALPADQNDLWVEGKKMAQWMPYEAGRLEQIESRLAKREADGVMQALVLMNDGFNVTGKYIEKCDRGLDETGQAQINFSFNDQGALRFGQLTSTYSPQDGKLHVLAIILDNKILTAPTIRSKITHQGRISGLGNMKEVDFIASAVNAGSLPYPIRLIAEESQFRTWREE